MSDSAFEIEIIAQRWTGATEADAERTDPCSHGDNEFWREFDVRLSRTLG